MRGVKAVVTIAISAVVAGTAMFTLGIRASHRPTPEPSSTRVVSALTTCELAVTRKVPVPPPADMTFAGVTSTAAAGGGYQFAGAVTADSARFRWTCDVELHPAGWWVWSVVVTPGSGSPAA